MNSPTVQISSVSPSLDKQITTWPLGNSEYENQIFDNKTDSYVENIYMYIYVVRSEHVRTFLHSTQDQVRLLVLTVLYYFSLHLYLSPAD